MTNPNYMVPAPVAAGRALCLAALWHRTRIETMRSRRIAPHESNVADLKRTSQRLADELNDWLKSEQLWDALSDSERTVLSRPAGGITRQELIHGSWRTEALAVVLWALNRVEGLPTYDTLADPEMSLEQIPLNQDVRGFVAKAELRSCDVLRDARAEAELWHWRARTYQIQHERDRSPLPNGRTYAEIIRTAAANGEEHGLFVAIDGDFPVFGKAYRDATDEEWSKLSSIASERHYALNWLCGDADDWDYVLTDT